MFYSLLKYLVGIFFNLLNLILGGNLPPFGCVSIVIEDQGRYLMIQHPEGYLSFPGGFMRWKEHPVQTARREAREETGLDLRIGDAVSCYSNTSDRLDRMSTLTIIYAAEVIGGELSNSIEGQPIWLEESELRDRVGSRFRSILDDYLRYRIKPTQFDVSS